MLISWAHSLDRGAQSQRVRNYGDQLGASRDSGTKSRWARDYGDRGIFANPRSKVLKTPNTSTRKNQSLEQRRYHSFGISVEIQQDCVLLR